MNKLRAVIREFIKQELEELSASGAAGPYDSPNAFEKGERKGTESRSKIALMAAGHSLVGGDTNEGVNPIVRLISIIKENAESEATREAHRLGLQAAPFGYWKKDGVNVARTVNGKLEWRKGHGPSGGAAAQPEPQQQAAPEPEKAPEPAKAPEPEKAPVKSAPEKKPVAKKTATKTAAKTPSKTAAKTPSKTAAKAPVKKAVANGGAVAEPKPKKTAIKAPEKAPETAPEKKSYPDDTVYGDAPVNPFMTLDPNPQDTSKILNVAGYKQSANFDVRKLAEFVMTAKVGSKAEDTIQISGHATKDVEDAEIMKRVKPWIMQGWGFEMVQDDSMTFEPENPHYPGGTPYQVVPKKQIPHVGFRLFFHKQR